MPSARTPLVPQRRTDGSVSWETGSEALERSASRAARFVVAGCRETACGTNADAEGAAPMADALGEAEAEPVEACASEIHSWAEGQAPR